MPLIQFTMMKLSKAKYRFFLHIVYWLMILFIYPIFMYLMGQPFFEHFMSKAFYLPPQILATYFLIYYQIPKLIYRKRHVSFALSFLFGTYVFGVMTHMLVDYGIAPILQNVDKICTPMEILADTGTALGYAQWFYLIAWFSAGVHLMEDRYWKQIRLTRLAKEKALAEVNYLKAQIHPRILSQTLRRLHDLTLHKAKNAPDIIIQLSDMLDYMLYGSNEGPLLLMEEVQWVARYLALEKLSESNKELTWDIDIHQLDAQATIMPLILIPMVEQLLLWSKTYNASAYFKLEAQGGQPDILIDLSCRIANFEGPKKTNTKEKVPDWGPINHQLEVLYPNQHQFQVGLLTPGELRICLKIANAGTLNLKEIHQKEVTHEPTY